MEVGGKTSRAGQSGGMIWNAKTQQMDARLGFAVRRSTAPVTFRCSGRFCLVDGHWCHFGFQVSNIMEKARDPSIWQERTMSNKPLFQDAKTFKALAGIFPDGPPQISN